MLAFFIQCRLILTTLFLHDRLYFKGRLAHLVERLVDVEKVAGSIPAPPTSFMIIKDTVVQGRGLGKSLGYPTANLAQSHGLTAGVYRVKVRVQPLTLPSPSRGEGNIMHNACLIVGAFTKADGGLAEEVYILDFEGDLYGKEITLEVFEKIREIQQFSNDAELKKQIQKDIAYVHGHHQV